PDPSEFDTFALPSNTSNGHSDMNKLLQSAKAGHKKYKTLNDKIENVQGYVDDAKKLQRFAVAVYKGGPGSSSEILELAYEGVSRLAQLLPAPSYVSKYLEFYQPGINALSELWRVKDEAELSLKWSSGLHEMEKNFCKGVDSIVSKYAYASEMVNKDGYVSSDLPDDLKMYLKAHSEYEAGMRDVRNAVRNVDWRKTLRAIETVDFHLEYAAGKHEYLMKQKKAVSMGVILAAKDIAAAHAHFAQTFARTREAGDKANKTMRKLTSSTNPAMSIGGSYVEGEMNWEIYKREVSDRITHGKPTAGLSNEDVQLILRGDWRDTSSYKHMSASMRKIRALAYDWSLWASWTANGKLLALY
ncbi:hypothetical protein, partial [Marivita geojedonensis]